MALKISQMKCITTMTNTEKGKRRKRKAASLFSLYNHYREKITLQAWAATIPTLLHQDKDNLLEFLRLLWELLWMLQTRKQMEEHQSTRSPLCLFWVAQAVVRARSVQTSSNILVLLT